MGVSFYKTGIVTASGEILNDNLLKGGYQCVTTSTTHTYSGSASAPDMADMILAHKGETLWFSFDYSTEGERSNSTGRGSSSLANRYGAHLSFRYYKGDGTLDSQRYPCASYLTMTGTGRAVMSYTLPTDISAVSDFGISLRPYAGPADGNDAVWYLRNFKLEIGEQATPWIPHKEDWGYIGADHGYIENGDLMKIYHERVDTTEFIEY